MFRFDDARDPWDRQLGETAEHYDWFQHWRNEGHRRSFRRTADKFKVTPARVTRAAETNKWTYRLDEFKADQSRHMRVRFDELIEASLVPYAQAIARLSAWAVQAPTDKVPADRALLAATAGLRLVREPTVQDLIRMTGAANRAAEREINLMSLVLDTLAQANPEAHDLVLDAIAEATETQALEG